jgi:hypothetical protein
MPLKFQVSQNKNISGNSQGKKIFDKFDHASPAKEESSTTVYMLVEELLKYR